MAKAILTVFSVQYRNGSSGWLWNSLNTRRLFSTESKAQAYADSRKAEHPATEYRVRPIEVE